MKQHSPGFLKVATEAKARVQEIAVQQLKQMLDENQPFYLVDVREIDEWQAGYLPNAMHLSKGIIERDIEKKIPDYAAKIVLYCGGGFRSALAADNLQKMGYQNVLSLDGGYSAWQAAGFEVKK